jgi:1-acyl-sn-glycerol-3-phosphate acyltransferase
MRATRRIVEAIDETMVPLRPGELETPRHPDRSRPVDMTRTRPRPGRP